MLLLDFFKLWISERKRHMKVNFAKVLGLLLALVLMLSGCNLIAVDAKMQADEEIAKIDQAYAQTVASYDGGDVRFAEVVGDFNALYNETSYMYYYYFGYEMSTEDVEMLMQDVLGARVRGEIVAAKFDEAHTLSEDELAQVEADAKSVYESYYVSAMDSAEGKTIEDKQENARVMLREAGFDYDTLYENIHTNARQSAMEEILRAEVADVTDEELQAAYDEKVAEQEISYIDGSSFEYAMSGEEELVCWQPEGYRTVKHILVMPEGDVRGAYTDAVYALENAQVDLEILADELIAANDDDLQEGERTAEEIQKEIDAINANMAGLEAAVADTRAACLAAVQETTDEIYARLESGEAFEDLIAEYGEDPGMQNEPTKSRGYYVSAGSQNWETNFRDASMELENVGDYTMEPVVSGSGVHIILYASDVQGGKIAFEDVRDALYAETLEARQEAHCEEIINAWVEAANPSYDIAAFNNVLMGE